MSGQFAFRPEWHSRRECEPDKLGDGEREIPLTNGMVTIADDEGYEWLSGLRWHAQKTRQALQFDRLGDRWVANRCGHQATRGNTAGRLSGCKATAR